MGIPKIRSRQKLAKKASSLDHPKITKYFCKVEKDVGGDTTTVSEQGAKPVQQDDSAVPTAVAATDSTIVAEQSNAEADKTNATVRTLTDPQSALLYKCGVSSADFRLSTHFLELGPDETFIDLTYWLKVIESLHDPLGIKLRKINGGRLPIDTLLALSLSHCAISGQLNGTFSHSWGQISGDDCPRSSSEGRRLMFSCRQMDLGAQEMYIEMAPSERARYLSWWGPSDWQASETSVLNVWTFLTAEESHTDGGDVRCHLAVKARDINAAASLPDLILVIMADEVLLIPFQAVFTSQKRTKGDLIRNKTQLRQNGLPQLRTVALKAEPEWLKVIWHYYPTSAPSRAWARQWAIPRDEHLGHALVCSLQKRLRQRQDGSSADDASLDFMRCFEELAAGE